MDKKLFVAEDVGTKNFNYFLMFEGLLRPGECLQLKDTTLKDFTNENVNSIKLKHDDGWIYKYQIIVDGSSRRSLKRAVMVFTDETGDEYKLSLYSSSSKTHTINYNSEKPNIKRITLKEIPA